MPDFSLTDPFEVEKHTNVYTFSKILVAVQNKKKSMQMKNLSAS